MININYSYEIVLVDAPSKCMVVKYTTEGFPPMQISTRLPYEGEDVEAVIRHYAPVNLWALSKAPVVAPELGTKGEVKAPEPPPVTLESVKTDKKVQIAEWRWQREVGGVNVGGTKIRTDRESQAQITSTLTSLEQGLLSSVDFKAQDGTWITLTLDEVKAVARAVAQHVQQSFTIERQLVEMVDAAETIEEVQAINPDVVYVV